MKKAILVAFLIMAVVLPLAAFAIVSTGGKSAVGVVPPTVTSRFEINNISLSLAGVSGPGATTPVGRPADLISVDVKIKNNAAEDQYYLTLDRSDAAGNRLTTASIIPVPYVSWLTGNGETTRNFLVWVLHDPSATYYFTAKLESRERSGGSGVWSSPVIRTASVTDTQLHAISAMTIGPRDLMAPVMH